MSNASLSDLSTTMNVIFKKIESTKGNKTWLNHLTNKHSGTIDLLILEGKYSIEEMAQELGKKFVGQDKNRDTWIKRVKGHMDHLMDGSWQDRSSAMKPHGLKTVIGPDGKIRFDLASTELNKEIEELTIVFGENGLTTNNTEDIQNDPEIQNGLSRGQFQPSAHAKGKKADQKATSTQKSSVSAGLTHAYKIVDGHSYSNIIRIRTKWKGRNRLLWVDKNDIDELFSHPENFKEVIRLFDTGKEWHQTGGRIKLGSNGTVMRWNACLVKKVGFFKFLFG